MPTRFLSIFDARPSFRVGFLLLLCVFLIWLAPVDFDCNEDHYFLLAHYQVSPEAFGEWSALIDHSNNRIVYNLLLGNLIEIFGDRPSLVIVRLVLALGFAASFALLAVRVGLSPVEAAAALGLATLLGPDLMGDEWIFKAAEAKSFAYALVFAAIGFLLGGRRWLAVSLAVAATYVHVLVGGFWFVFMLAVLLGMGSGLRSAARLFGWYAICVLPMVGLIAYEQLFSLAGGPSESADGLSPSYIYSIFRLPHHAAPFEDPRTWAKGFAANLALLLSLVAMRSAARDHLKALVQGLILVSVFLFLALGLSYLDRHSGILGKFYLFRPSALLLLLSTMAGFALLRQSLPSGHRALRAAIAGPVILLFAAHVLATPARQVLDKTTEDMRELATRIQAVTKRDDVVLIQPTRDLSCHGRSRETAMLPRLLDRPTLVSWKYLPSLPADVIEWYERFRFAERTFAGSCPEAADYPVDYLLYLELDNPAAARLCGATVWTDGRRALVKVDAAK